MALQPSPLRLAMVAGEPSGDLLAASLLDGLSITASVARA
jgi:lipid-A-disaccharide synthase